MAFQGFPTAALDFYDDLTLETVCASRDTPSQRARG